MTGCHHLLEWYLRDGYRYRCKLCGHLLKIASGRYPTEPKPHEMQGELDAAAERCYRNPTN